MLRCCFFLFLFLLLQDAPLWAGQGGEQEKEAYKAQCAGCHAFDCDLYGPRLAGLFGRRAGSVASYPDYSDHLKSLQLVWTEAALDVFLADPNGLIPGTIMSYAGKIEDPAARQDVIAFIKSGDRSLDDCE